MLKIIGVIFIAAAAWWFITYPVNDDNVVDTNTQNDTFQID